MLCSGALTDGRIERFGCVCGGLGFVSEPSGSRDAPSFITGKSALLRTVADTRSFHILPSWEFKTIHQNNNININQEQYIRNQNRLYVGPCWAISRLETLLGRIKCYITKTLKPIFSPHFSFSQKEKVISPSNDLILFQSPKTRKYELRDQGYLSI